MPEYPLTPRRIMAVVAVLLLSSALTLYAVTTSLSPASAGGKDQQDQVVQAATGGYLVLTSTGEVVAVNDATAHGGIENLPDAAPVTLVMVDGGDGYYVVEANGRVTGFGTRQGSNLGDLTAYDLAQPIVDMVMTPTGQGYWLLGRDGGVFALGDAPYLGSVPQYVAYQDLVAPVVAMVANPTGTGYWIFAADGGVFAFGDAPYLGSVPQYVAYQDLVAPVVGATPTPDGRGYGLVAADGGVFAFGNFAFEGSLAGTITGGYVDLAVRDDGYDLLDRTGWIKAPDRTPLATGRGDVVAMATLPGTTRPADPAPAPLDQIALSTELVATVNQPLDLVPGPDGALYVASKTGTVSRVDPDATNQTGTLWLDLRDRISDSGERGLLGIAFGPNGRFYASYTDRQGNSRLVAWELKDGSPDPTTEATIIGVDQPFANHNGGHIEFGPDGYLYYGLGDGGSGNDPNGNGQDTATLLGSILRLNVTDTSTGYAIPPDNPANGDPNIIRPEIWLYGVRNPWRFSFDPATGDLWIGDVGQNAYEEVDFLPADGTGRNAGRGANLGWGAIEGNTPTNNGNTLISDPTPPILVYDHSTGESVTGGRVYRGDKIPQLRGTYLYSDYETGDLWAIRRNPGSSTQETATLIQAVGPVVGFGTDDQGELYMLNLNGQVLKVVPGG